MMMEKSRLSFLNRGDTSITAGKFKCPYGDTVTFWRGGCTSSSTMAAAAHTRGGAYLAKPHFAKSESAIQESAKLYLAKPHSAKPYPAKPISGIC